MKLLLQHRILLGYIILIAVIGSMAAILIYERTQLEILEEKTVEIQQISIRNALRSYVYISAGERSPNRLLFSNMATKLINNLNFQPSFFLFFTLFRCLSVHNLSSYYIRWSCLYPITGRHPSCCRLSVQGRAGYVLFPLHRSSTQSRCRPGGSSR